MTRSPSPDRHSSAHRSRDDSSRSDRHRSDRDRDPRPSTSSRSHKHSDDRDRDRDRDSHRDRHRSRSRSPARRRDRSRSRSGERDDRDGHRSGYKSKSSSSRRRERSRSVSSEDSRESRDSRRHKSSRGASGGETKEERRRRRDQKKAKIARKEAKKKGLQPVEWGKYGILNEADIYTKDSEFRAWLIGEKMLNPETMTKAKEKEHFKEFMEDFNTGTINEKYVDLGKWEKKQAAIRNGETIEETSGYDARADLESVRNSHKRAPVTTETFLDRSQLEDLRRVQSERVELERMKRLGMEVSQSFGVRLEKR